MITMNYIMKERRPIHWLCFGSLHGKCNRLGDSSLSFHLALQMKNWCNGYRKSAWHWVFFCCCCFNYISFWQNLSVLLILFSTECKPASPESRLCDWYVRLCHAHRALNMLLLMMLLSWFVLATQMWFQWGQCKLLRQKFTLEQGWRSHHNLEGQKRNSAQDNPLGSG